MYLMNGSQRNVPSINIKETFRLLITVFVIIIIIIIIIKIIIRDNEMGTCMLIDVAISGDRNVINL